MANAITFLQTLFSSEGVAIQQSTGPEPIRPLVVSHADVRELPVALRWFCRSKDTQLSKPLRLPLLKTPARRTGWLQTRLAGGRIFVDPVHHQGRREERARREVSSTSAWNVRADSISVGANSWSSYAESLDESAPSPPHNSGS